MGDDEDLVRPPCLLVLLLCWCPFALQLPAAAAGPACCSVGAHFGRHWPAPRLAPGHQPAVADSLALHATSVSCCLQGEVEINLEEARGPIREWIAQEPVRREIGRRFAKLLKTFVDENGDHVYKQRVRDMVRSELASRMTCLGAGRERGQLG